MFILVVLAALSVWAIAATIRSVFIDGYRPAPVKPPADDARHATRELARL